MTSTRPPRPTRRLASLPARIVLFVCAATLVTAGLIGLLALRESGESVARHLDDASRNVLALGRLPTRAELEQLGEPRWQSASLDPAGRVRAGDANVGWELPADWPAALGKLEPGAFTPLQTFTATDGQAWVIRAGPRSDWQGWVLVRSRFEAAYAPILALVPRLFGIGLGSVFIFCLIAYRFTSSVVQPIELLAAEARRISQGDLHFELSLPVRTDEVGLLTRTFNDMVRKLRRNQQQIEDANVRLTDQNQQLQRANEVLAQLSITDGLTRLHNHRFFQDQLAREIKRCERTGDPLGMVLADIDDFKLLNDTYGHATGDELLVRIAGVMNEAIRESDFLARYGGEEFAILTTGTDLAGAETLAEKIRLRIADAQWEPSDHPGERIDVTVSIGIALYRGDRRAFFRDADRALYLAKDMGKNCVVVDEESRRWEASHPSP